MKRGFLGPLYKENKESSLDFDSAVIKAMASRVQNRTPLNREMSVEKMDQKIGPLEPNLYQ